VLYFLLTGQPPFPGGTMIQKLDKHRSKQPFPVDQLRQGLPARLVAVLGKLLSKRPVERYQTPADVAAALGDVVQPETLLAKGAKVTILEGTYAGNVGHVLDATSDLRIRVEINLMGRRVPVSIERWMLKPVEAPGK
jgi:transcription antitermination factor NusG